ncbi:hypothetical protein [Demequina sp. NBRC 110055]|uniref:hypothetical protein n=1 Tax=Demequina sp. NBRC 110055 TaxID=1570344 RepID=UPI0009FC96C4|nr:hypothetical protein [Demequina sp. NBRC 110055]
MRVSTLALPLAAALMVAGCTGGDDQARPTASATTDTTVPAGSEPSEAPSSQTDADIDVDSSGDPTDGAQDAEGTASLGTAAATIAVALPGEWQYEGTYGDGTAPYAVLVDASEPFDLSEPGSDAYRDSVWVQVETYRVEGQASFAEAVAGDADALADQLVDAYGGEVDVIDGRDVPVVFAAYEKDGDQIEDLYALHGDLWIMARPSNVDVTDYVDGGEVTILEAVLEDAQIK